MEPTTRSRHPPDPARFRYTPLSASIIIDVAVEAQKISFTRTQKHHYISYSVTYDGREIGQIPFYETKCLDGKTQEAAESFLKYKLQTMHLHLRNEELSTIIAKRIYDDYVIAKTS